MRWVIPKLFELAAGKLRTDLQSSVQKMSASPIGVVPFITFQNNKHEIEERFTEYEERIMQLGYIFDVMRDMDSHG